MRRSPSGGSIVVPAVTEEQVKGAIAFLSPNVTLFSISAFIREEVKEDNIMAGRGMNRHGNQNVVPLLAGVVSVTLIAVVGVFCFTAIQFAGGQNSLELDIEATKESVKIGTKVNGQSDITQ